jgi:hypothetical protein
VYLETTIFSFPFADDAPQYREDTRRLWDAVRAGRFDAYTSEYVEDEIERTDDEKRRADMRELLNLPCVKMLTKSGDAERLADAYIAEGTISPLYRTDATHIAMTTVNGLDFIASLNFQHIVREWTIERVSKINAREGFKQIGLYKPAEVFEHENG